MLMLYESWTQFAERIGAAQYGAKSLTASYVVVQNDHVGTHLDAVKHIRGPEAPGVEGIPLEYCFSDGVVLDFRHKEKGTRICRLWRPKVSRWSFNRMQKPFSRSTFPMHSQKFLRCYRK